AKMESSKNMTMKNPTQELVAKDIHGVQWKFKHIYRVRCIQFNPVDENYFISSSIDVKVRIWRMHEERVVDWADIRDVITAISYQPIEKGFVVSSLTSICHFYVASDLGKHFHLEAQINENTNILQQDNWNSVFQEKPLKSHDHIKRFRSPNIRRHGTCSDI
ncbi:hypothetical protein HN51_055186, partial [Arachis hypogaea]